MVVINRIPELIKKAQDLDAARVLATNWVPDNGVFLNEILAMHTEILQDNNVELYQLAYDGYLESIVRREKDKGDFVNHKIQATLGGLIVDFVVDYMLGKAMVWSFEDKADKGSPTKQKQDLMDDYRQRLLDLLENEEGQRVLRELLTMGSVSGYWAALVWLEDGKEIDFEDFPIQEIVPVYDPRGRLQLVIRFYDEIERDELGTPTGLVTTKAEIYDDRYVTFAVKNGTSEYFELDMDVSVSEIPVYEHGAAQIPVTIFTNGSPASYAARKKRAGVSDYAGGILDLIEEYAHAISDKANLADRLQDALLVLTGVELGATPEEGQGEVLAMRKARAIGLKSKESSAQFIAPPQDDAAVENHLNRVRDTIHEKAFIPKLSDLSGATATEIKVKYAGTDIKAGKKEVYFTGSVKKLVAVLTDFINSSRLQEAGVKPEDLYLVLTGESQNTKGVELYNPDWVTFTLNRNMPQNYLEITNIVAQLNGIVPDSYLYELLWFISDPQAALDEMKKQKESTAAATTSALFPPGFTNTGSGAEAPPDGTGSDPATTPGDPAAPQPDPIAGT